MSVHWHTHSNALKYLVIAVTIYLVLVALGVMFFLTEGLGWADLAQLSGLQWALAFLLVAPVIGLLCLLAQAVGELIFGVLAWVTFSIATFGQISPGDTQQDYRWGLARDYGGQLVASEGLVITVAVITWIAVGIGGFLWWPF